MVSLESLGCSTATGQPAVVLAASAGTREDLGFLPPAEHPLRIPRVTAMDYRPHHSHERAGNSDAEQERDER